MAFKIDLFVNIKFIEDLLKSSYPTKCNVLSAEYNDRTVSISTGQCPKVNLVLNVHRNHKAY